MSLGKSKCWYSKNLFTFLKYSVSLYNGLECLSLARLSCLVFCNTLAYWADSYVTKKMKCCESGPRLLVESKTVNYFNFSQLRKFTKNILFRQSLYNKTFYSRNLFQPSLIFQARLRACSYSGDTLWLLHSGKLLGSIYLPLVLPRYQAYTTPH